MLTTKPALDWYFLEEEGTKTGDHAFLPPATDTTDPSNDMSAAADPYRLYELLLGIALIYGILVYFIWQQAEQRIEVLEQDVVALRSVVVQQQHDNHIERTNNGAPITLGDDGTSERYRFETEYLRFEVSKRTLKLMAAAYSDYEAGESTIVIMQSIASASDLQYRQLHQDFHLPHEISVDKLKFIIDPPYPNSPSGADLTLVIPLTKIIAGRDSTSIANALADEIQAMVTEYLLDKTLDDQMIKSNSGP